MTAGLALHASLALILAGVLGAPGTRASAQNYPTRPLRVIVPIAPGGSTDIVARIVGQRLSESLKQSVVIENRASADGVVGIELAARSAPDGYTLLAAAGQGLVILPNFRPKLPYDAVKDFAPITLAVTFSYLFVAHPSLPTSTVKDLIALARSKPGKLNVATGGFATPAQLGVELFKTMAKVNMTQIVYKGAGASLTDVLGGHVELTFAGLPALLPHVKSGKLRALGISAAQRSSLLPEVPTINEAGLPGFEVSQWVGWFAPAGTSREIVMILNREIGRILHHEDTKRLLVQQGAEPAGTSPEQFAQYMKTETAKWANVIKVAGIKLEY